MSLDIKIGKGVNHKINTKFSMSFGLLEANINKKHSTLSLKEIAKQLAKQSKIKDGIITIHHIAFNYHKMEAK